MATGETRAAEHDRSERLYDYDTDHVPIPFGIYNRGATCWLNAAVQGLASLSCVVKWLAIATAADNRYADATARTMTSAEKHAAALRACVFVTIGQYTPEYAAGGAPQTVVDPTALMRLFRTVMVQDRRSLDPTAPNQDATEGIVALIDVLDLHLPRGTPVLAKYVMHDSSVWSACCACEGETKKQVAASLHVEMFGRRSSVRARAPENKKRARFVGELLRHESAIDSGYKCEHCGETGRGVQFTRLRYVREVLSVVFNRYTNNRSDGYLPAEIKIALKSPDSPGGNPVQAVYLLVATIQHAGVYTATGGGGHYWATALRRVGPDDPHTYKGSEKIDGGGGGGDDDDTFEYVQPFVLNDSETHACSALAGNPNTVMGLYHLKSIH
jgi:hypothetical protein